MVLSEILLILISLIMTGMVPWAYKVHGRLTAIEVGLNDSKELKITIAVLRDEIHRMDVRMAKIENGD